MNTIEIYEYDNLLVYKKNYSIDFIKNTVERQKLNGLRIFDHLDPLESLDFLKECSFLKALSISSLHDHDYSFLKNLYNLNLLSIGSSVKNDNTIDLSHQTNLEDLVITWRKNIIGIEHCVNLKTICLVEFKQKTLSSIAALTSLRELIIKTAGIQNLDGLEKIEGLESVLFGNCSHLKLISGLNKMAKLKKIVLDECPKIEDYEKLTDLPVLEELDLFSCKIISSIKFIKQIPSLKRLIISGNTIIADGDLTPVLDLKEVCYSNRKNYNISFPPSNWRKF